MNPTPRVMLLVDADNVSADVVEQAVARVMDERGAIHVRRAYCTAESALKNLQLFKRLSIRPMVNLVDRARTRPTSRSPSMRSTSSSPSGPTWSSSSRRTPTSRRS